MNTMTFGTEYLSELESEVRATRRCLEAIPENLYGWKPHEKSMNMGYLTLLVADIPRWITYAIEKSVIDFATYDQFQLSTNAALLKHFDQAIEDAKQALKTVSNEELSEPFYLKNNTQTCIQRPRKNACSRR